MSSEYRCRTPSPTRAFSSESPDLPLSSNRSLGKRHRDNSPAAAEEISKEKTRRVNPYRLAERLGADLVAELEAFIYPGAKMPSYSERKVVQDRYSVDRRHIYDYLHSRGLRVAKEDRHLNLHRNRLQQKQQTSRPPAKKPKPLPPARPRTPRTTKVKRSITPSPTPEFSQNTTPVSIQTVHTEDVIHPISLLPNTQMTETHSDERKNSYEGDQICHEHMATLSPISIKERICWEPKFAPFDNSISSEPLEFDEYSLDPILADELLTTVFDMDAIVEPTHSTSSSPPLIQETGNVYDLISSSLDHGYHFHESSAYSSRTVEEQFEYPYSKPAAPFEFASSPCNQNVLSKEFKPSPPSVDRLAEYSLIYKENDPSNSAWISTASGIAAAHDVPLPHCSSVPTPSQDTFPSIGSQAASYLPQTSHAAVQKSSYFNMATHPCTPSMSYSTPFPVAHRAAFTSYNLPAWVRTASAGGV